MTDFKKTPFAEFAKQFMDEESFNLFPYQVELAEQLKKQYPMRVLVRNRRTNDSHVKNSSTLKFFSTKGIKLEKTDDEVPRYLDKNVYHNYDDIIKRDLLSRRSKIKPLVRLSIEYGKLRVVIERTTDLNDQSMLVDVLEHLTRLEKQDAVMKDMLQRYAPELLDRITSDEAPF